MKTKDLWLKWQNSGINGNPVITDHELEILKDRLYDFYDFFKVYNPIPPALAMNTDSINTILENRKRK